MKKLILVALAFAGLNAIAGNTIGIKPVVNTPSCYGKSDGSITLVVTGGVAPYSYHWNNTSANTPTLSNVSSGNYIVTVTDHDGEQAVYSLTLAEPAGLHLNTSAQNVTEHGGDNGCITLSVTGGTPDYTFKWSNSANVESPCGLVAGLYTVTVTDAFGCTSVTSKEVYQPANEMHGNHISGNSQGFYANVPQSENNGELKSDDIPGGSDNSTQSKLTANDVTVYPNPASSLVTVRIETALNTDLTLINSIGQNVMHTKANATETQLDLSDLAKGNYILTIKTETGTVNKMISVIK